MRDILERIERNCDFVRDFVNNISLDTLEISQLDLDLTKQHIRELYDAFLLFEKMIGTENSPEISSGEEEIADVDDFLTGLDEDMEEIFAEIDGAGDEVENHEEAPSEPQPANEDVAQENIEEEVLAKAQSGNGGEVDTQVENEEKTEEEVEAAAAEKPVEPTEPEKEEIRQDPPAADVPEEPVKEEKKVKQPETGVKTLFDILEDKGSERLQDKVSHQSIADLREAIGINEKFRFINRLFRGDMNEYNKVIDKLNGLSTIDEADTFLFTYKVRYEWDEEGEVYREFRAIVERRYP